MSTRRAGLGSAATVRLVAGEEPRGRGDGVGGPAGTDGPARQMDLSLLPPKRGLTLRGRSLRSDPIDLTDQP